MLSCPWLFYSEAHRSIQQGEFTAQAMGMAAPQNAAALTSKYLFQIKIICERMKQKIDPDSYIDDEEFVLSHVRPRVRRSILKSTPQGKPGHAKVITDAVERANVLTDIVERSDKAAEELSSGFYPSLHTSFHERFWILNYLGVFYDNQVITDVLRKVKGGKEANVYCCEAHPTTGLDLTAAKIYRPRMFRNLRNDAIYRQGRVVLDKDSKAVRRSREAKAIEKNTRFGQELRSTSWLEHEYQSLEMLYDAGADVPKPLTHGESVILMEYIGEVETPAPTLNQVTLRRSEARRMFDRILENIAIMLSCHRVHADLSAYNVLYWDGQFKIIDLPQAIDPRHNPQAYPIFVRDVERICQYFRSYGINPNVHSLADDLWRRYQFTNALDAAYEPDEDESDNL